MEYFKVNVKQHTVLDPSKTLSFEEYGLIYSGRDINYFDLAKHLMSKEGFEIKYYDGSFYLKKDNKP